MPKKNLKHALDALNEALGKTVSANRPSKLEHLVTSGKLSVDDVAGGIAKLLIDAGMNRSLVTQLELAITEALGNKTAIDMNIVDM